MFQADVKSKIVVTDVHAPNLGLRFRLMLSANVYVQTQDQGYINAKTVTTLMYMGGFSFQTKDLILHPLQHR